MNLQEHLDLIGHDVGLFAYKSKVPKSIIENALAGRPIPLVHAEKIAKQLNNEHGLHQKTSGALLHDDIDGLIVVHPTELKT